MADTKTEMVAVEVITVMEEIVMTTVMEVVDTATEIIIETEILVETVAVVGGTMVVGTVGGKMMKMLHNGKIMMDQLTGMKSLKLLIKHVKTVIAKTHGTTKKKQVKQLMLQQKHQKKRNLKIKIIMPGADKVIDTSL